MSSSRPNNAANDSNRKPPNTFSEDEEDIQRAKECLVKDDFRRAITTAFNLDENDDFVYHAVASVTLEQVQQIIESGGKNGLHQWYVDAEGKSLGNPPSIDISAYTSIFAPSRSSANTLKSLASNAKKDSLRVSVAANLTTKRHISPNLMSIPKRKASHLNPYLDFWTWSCHNLEWAGPTPHASLVHTSHAILPILMHHFGCVVPSYEALELIKQVAKGRLVCDIGSGTGYWTWMLRRHGLEARAVDDLQSTFRTMWIADTVVEDGAKWLKKRGGAVDDVLLMVYPIVGREFVKVVTEAYKGKCVVVAGTQNRSGYTAFRDRTVDEWMAEKRPDFQMMARVPLPSFAGKDEALYVFQRD